MSFAGRLKSFPQSGNVQGMVFKFDGNRGEDPDEKGVNGADLLGWMSSSALSSFEVSSSNESDSLKMVQ